MNNSNDHNQFAVMAATFGLIGLALLLSVMLWHQEINQRLSVWQTAVAAETVAVAQPETKLTAVDQSTPLTTAVPASIIKEITEDPRNFIDRPIGTPADETSPALKFLYTLNSPSVFPTQR